MRVGADALALALLGVGIALVVGGRWVRLSRSRADLAGAKAGIGKARTSRNSAFKSVILPLGVFGLFVYLLIANAR